MVILKANLKYRYPLRKLTNPTTVTIHHDNDRNLNDSNISNNESLHRYHKSLGWSGAGYNFMVYNDGEVFSLRGMNRGAHCKYANGYSIGICINGDFHGSNAYTPTREQLNSAAQLIKYLMNKYPTIKTIKPHKDMPRATTVCPGNQFPYDKLIRMVHIDEPKQYKRPLKLTDPYTRGNDVKDLQKELNILGHKCGITDGIFGKQTESGVKSFQSFVYPHNGAVNKPLWEEIFDYSK